MKKEKNETSRRDFLKTALTATAVGAACFSFGGLKEALGAARRADKPLLSAENVNALVPKEPDEMYFKLGKEAVRDPLAFLKKYFYIAPEQEKGLASLPPDEVQKLRKGIQEGLAKKYNFVVAVAGERGQLQLRDNAKIVNAHAVRGNWSVEVGLEGGTKNGNFEGSVTVTVKKN